MNSISSSAPPAATSNAPLYWMALGTFAIGTEGFMIAGMLPTVAHDLGVSAAVAGQLVVAFTAAYAISSPILTALTGAINRRRLLIGTMSLFALANLLAWQAPGWVYSSVHRMHRLWAVLLLCKASGEILFLR